MLHLLNAVVASAFSAREDNPFAEQANLQDLAVEELFADADLEEQLEEFFASNVTLKA